MAIYDWTRVEAGIFHDFHHAWIEEIKRALNSGILPDDYYALAEQFAGGFGPDVLTLEGPASDAEEDALAPPSAGGNGGVLLATPNVKLTDETDREFYRRKQNAIVVRHVRGDRVVEIVSPGNKPGLRVFQAFVERAAELIDQQVHLLLLDVFPPGPRDPQGIHGAIWEDIAGEFYTLPAGSLLTFAAYEAGLRVRAYAQHPALGDELPDMPLFLAREACVKVPLAQCYQSAYAAVPRRWRRVLDR